MHDVWRHAAAGASAQRVAQDEALQAVTGVGYLAYHLEHALGEGLAQGEAACVVVGEVLAVRHEVVGVEQVTEASRAHLICTSFKVTRTKLKC